MRRKSEQLALQREVLLLKIRAQRQLLALQVEDLKQSTEVAEFGYHCARRLVGTLRHQPLLTAAITAAALLIKPTRIASVAKAAINTWQMWRAIAPLIKQFKSDAKSTDAK
ncbi:YqjK family protein [Undibacterium sp. RuRC25W]|uniref:YqjK family protein n=1 Tax=Undibacterium sp. RuRC25W TaxID=3413047 RepID=UPI003BF04E4B